MTDFAKRLRAKPCPKAIRMEAAAEIEVLQGRISRKDDTIQWLHTEIETLRAEALENARIIGMSAERELALRAEVERLTKAMKGGSG